MAAVDEWLPAEILIKFLSNYLINSKNSHKISPAIEVAHRVKLWLSPPSLSSVKRRWPPPAAVMVLLLFTIEVTEALETFVVPPPVEDMTAERSFLRGLFRGAFNGWNQKNCPNFASLSPQPQTLLKTFWLANVAPKSSSLSWPNCRFAPLILSAFRQAAECPEVTLGFFFWSVEWPPRLLAGNLAWKCQKRQLEIKNRTDLLDGVMITWVLTAAAKVPGSKNWWVCAGCNCLRSGDSWLCCFFLNIWKC